ncbi:MAG: AAA family ATPase [Armatimonadota bacterium]
MTDTTAEQTTAQPAATTEPAQVAPHSEAEVLEAKKKNELKPRWMRDLERLTSYKTQIYLYGNIKDTVLYPLGKEQNEWTLGPLLESLFELLRRQIGPYEIVAAYNSVDGILFADARDDNNMVKYFDEVVAEVEKSQGPPAKSRVPQPTKPRDPIEHAMQLIRLALLNKQKPAAFIIEHASQLIASPVALQAAERLNFLRMLRSSQESQIVAVGEAAQRRAVQNLLILLCDKLADLPPWLYLDNPFTGGIQVEAPASTERKHFFDLFLRSKAEIPELVDLTEGMTIRDLCGIRSLARRPESANLSEKALVDYFKYGVKESEWDHLDWKRLESAEEELSRRVIGQSAAVSAAADVLRRARLHLSGAQTSKRNKPRGVLFFAGPTGVGKTELAKSIAELVFGTDDACVQFDMSEYNLQHADQRLLGAPPGYVGYEEGGQLTNRMKTNPFAVLLFDEIEKAHPSILDKFLQILEDGRMTDGRGDTVYFGESIIVFTSNVGIYRLDPTTWSPMVDPATSQPILHVDPNIDVQYDAVRNKVLEGVQAYFKHILGRPELLNRIGQNIIVFDFIRPPVMRQILERKVLRSIQQQVRERWKLDVQFSETVLDQMMNIGGNDVSVGGRGMGNLAEAAILNPLARVMFSLLNESGTLEGKTLTITGIIPPCAENNHRYEITWEA